MNETRRIYRIEEGKVLTGVCGGIAEYFNLDPNLVRVIWVILFFAASLGFWAYLACTLILPKKSQVWPDHPYDPEDFH